MDGFQLGHGRPPPGVDSGTIEIQFKISNGRSKHDGGGGSRGGGGGGGGNSKSEKEEEWWRF